MYTLYSVWENIVYFRPEHAVLLICKQRYVSYFFHEPPRIFCISVYTFPKILQQKLIKN